MRKARTTALLYADILKFTFVGNETKLKALCTTATPNKLTLYKMCIYTHVHMDIRVHTHISLTHLCMHGKFLEGYTGNLAWLRLETRAPRLLLFYLLEYFRNLSFQ